DLLFGPNKSYETAMTDWKKWRDEHPDRLISAIKPKPARRKGKTEPHQTPPQPLPATPAAPARLDKIAEFDGVVQKQVGQIVMNKAKQPVLVAEPEPVAEQRVATSDPVAKQATPQLQRITEQRVAEPPQITEQPAAEPEPVAEQPAAR